MFEALRFGPAFAWSFAWQATVFLLLGLAGSLIWSRRPARGHRMLVLAMLGALMAPLLTWGIHQLGWGLWPVRAAVKPDAITSPVIDTSQAFVPSSPNSGPDLKAIAVPPVIPSPLASAATSTDQSSASGSSSTVPTHSSRVGWSWSMELLGAWLALSVLVLIRLAVSVFSGLRLVRDSEALEHHSLVESAAIASRKLGLSEAPVIRGSSRVSCPVIWCWGPRPLILVPAPSADASGSVDWVGVLSHE